MATVLLDTTELINAAYPRLGDLVRLPDQTIAAVPLVLDGRALGGFVVSFPEPRRLSADDRALLIAVAHQAAQALERARLHEAPLFRLRAAAKRLSLEINQCPDVPRYLVSDEGKPPGAGRSVRLRRDR